jgi:hypothetical protein
VHDEDICQFVMALRAFSPRHFLMNQSHGSSIVWNAIVNASIATSQHGHPDE